MHMQQIAMLETAMTALLQLDTDLIEDGHELELTRDAYDVLEFDMLGMKLDDDIDDVRHVADVLGTLIMQAKDRLSHNDTNG